MYKSRPSKQQQRKGIQLIKNLVLSRTNINQHSTYNINNQNQIWSSASLMTITKNDKKELNLSTSNKVNKTLIQSAQLINSNHKGSLMNQNYRDNPQIAKTTLSNKLKINLGKQSLKESNLLKNTHHQKIDTIKKRQIQKNHHRVKTQTNQTIALSLRQWLSKSNEKNIPNHQQPLYGLKSKSKQDLKESKLIIPLTRSMSREDRNTSVKKDQRIKTNGKSMEQIFLPIKGSTSRLIQIPKLPSHYKKAKEKTTLENVYRLQKDLVIQRQEIKKVRREFMEVLENTKRFMPIYEKELHHISTRQTFISNQRQNFQIQKVNRLQSKLVLEGQLSKVHAQIREQNQAYNTKKLQLQNQIMSKQQLNSSMARKIYQLKTHLHTAHQQKQKINQINHKNQLLLQTVIKKQQKITSLKKQKSKKLFEQKQRLKQFIQVQIQIQDKKKIYERLDNKLNLIKEYFKISQNAKEFKRTIKKLTQFDAFHKQVQVFTKSGIYSQEIMQLYRSGLWNTEMPRFFESQPLILESPKIRQIKNTYKQLQLKRQSLNKYIKEKQKIVDSLSYRCKKLIQQIQHLQGKKSKFEENDLNEQYSPNRETFNRINWGF